MADDPVPFQFPPAAPFAEPPAEEFREPKRKRGPRKVKVEAPKKRGPKPGSKRKPREVRPLRFSDPNDLPTPPSPLTFSEMAIISGQLVALLEAVASPSQRKELLTYLLGQQ